MVKSQCHGDWEPQEHWATGNGFKLRESGLDLIIVRNSSLGG